MKTEVQLLRIIGRAGLQPWPKLFHNLRASRETELSEDYSKGHPKMDNALSRLKEIEEEVKKEIQEAIEFTDQSPYPALEEIYTDLVYEERRAV